MSTVSASEWGKFTVQELQEADRQERWKDIYIVVQRAITAARMGNLYDQVVLTKWQITRLAPVMRKLGLTYWDGWKTIEEGNDQGWRSLEDVLGRVFCDTVGFFNFGIISGSQLPVVRWRAIDLLFFAGGGSETFQQMSIRRNVKIGIDRRAPAKGHFIVPEPNIYTQVAIELMMCYLSQRPTLTIFNGLLDDLKEITKKGGRAEQDVAGQFATYCVKTLLETAKESTKAPVFTEVNRAIDVLNNSRVELNATEYGEARHMLTAITGYDPPKPRASKRRKTAAQA